MRDLEDRILNLYDRGDDLLIAGLFLAIELAELGRAELVREVGNLMASDRVPGHLRVSDVDRELASILARQVGKREHVCWAQLTWQILEAGDRELLDQLESLMRRRMSN